MKAQNIRALLVSAALLAISAAPARAAGPTLFERMGGQATLTAVVDEFVVIMESDDRINFTFADTDLTKFKKLLSDQICALTGGPCQYTGRDMFESHKKLNIKNSQFNALAEDLYLAFDRLRVPYKVQNEVMALLAPMQRDIVK